MLITPGRLVYALVATGLLGEDGGIDIISIDLDLTGPCTNP